MIAPMFTDCEGHVWRPVCTVQAVRLFEGKTGIGLFEAVFNTLQSATEENNPESVPGKDLMDMVKHIFGSFDPLMVFLYECVREDDQAKKLTIDAFCRRVRKEHVLDAMMCALSVLMDFFPTVDADKRAEEALGPFAPTHGETSSSSPESQESTPESTP